MMSVLGLFVGEARRGSHRRQEPATCAAVKTAKKAAQRQSGTANDGLGG